MNFVAQVFAIGLVIGCPPALAAEAGAASGSTPSNQFGGPLDIGTAGPRIIVSGEDLSNPFVEAHPIESQRYQGLYYGHYHGLFYDVNAPVLAKMPSAVDGEGRPLWFDGPYGDASLRRLVAGLFNRGQFDDVERLFEDWNNPSERMADGRWKLVAFHAAIMNIRFADTNSWNAGYQAIHRWRERKPKSRAAALVEAIYWYSYAWNARGEGAADTVTDEGWKLFRERLEKAEAVLLDSKAYASSSPLWGRVYVDVGGALDWPKPKLLQAFLESTSREQHYDPIYSSIAASLTPRWGGNWGLVDAFIQEAVKETQATKGYSTYARLYWLLRRREGARFELFRDSLAKWPEMKRGFEDIVHRYPHSAYDMNNFAAAACIAGDRETYRSIRFRIGRVVTPESWPSNYSLDVCDHKLAAPAL